jgi:hypothetical protein
MNPLGNCLALGKGIELLGFAGQLIKGIKAKGNNK